MATTDTGKLVIENNEFAWKVLPVYIVATGGAGFMFVRLWLKGDFSAVPIIFLSVLAGIVVFMTAALVLGAFEKRTVAFDPANRTVEVASRWLGQENQECRVPWQVVSEVLVEKTKGKKGIVFFEVKLALREDNKEITVKCLVDEEKARELKEKIVSLMWPKDWEKS